MDAPGPERPLLRKNAAVPKEGRVTGHLGVYIRDKELERIRRSRSAVTQLLVKLRVRSAPFGVRTVVLVIRGATDQGHVLTAEEPRQRQVEVLPPVPTRCGRVEVQKPASRLRSAPTPTSPPCLGHPSRYGHLSRLHRHSGLCIPATSAQVSLHLTSRATRDRSLSVSLSTDPLLRTTESRVYEPPSAVTNPELIEMA